MLYYCDTNFWLLNYSEDISLAIHYFKKMELLVFFALFQLILSDNSLLPDHNYLIYLNNRYCKYF